MCGRDDRSFHVNYVTIVDGGGAGGSNKMITGIEGKTTLIHEEKTF